MSSPVRIFVTSSKARANQEAAVLLAQGYDVVVTGPTDSVIVRTAKGDDKGEDAWGDPFQQMWVVFAFNKTADDAVIID